MNQKSKVSIVHIHEQNTYAALENAVELLGGLEDTIPRGSKILIKPNLVMGPTERGITNPIVILVGKSNHLQIQLNDRI